MAKTVQFSANAYSDAAYVQGVANHNNMIIHHLERHCRNYFNDHYQSIFFCGEDMRMEIFQDAFIRLWQNIEVGRLHVVDGVLFGDNNEPFTSSLTTYFMSIAKRKYLEYVRKIKNESEAKKGLLPKEPADADYLYDGNTICMEDIIADCIAAMSERCNQILTKFYYEDKTLDDILTEIPSFTNKNALKTMKYKCMETLRANAQAIYYRNLNS